ncbi:DUF6503 family protein [Arenibacter sp. GZD96]|uniref:DUF6503 family protein n=1 Tax=Aurantibrevibacter litoralis TaxID=3106030 RepID=UPI002AFF7412|nr:DUF6503 family protein [Arenibacter sp. GZD-96]MEA1787347.1 DUF6503 family protein [Arenibacter sp. GZD-96]
MKNYKITLILTILILTSCREKNKDAFTAQQIIDKAIEVSGGSRYKTKSIAFDFRDRSYFSQPSGKGKVLQRLLKNDTITLLDVKSPDGFQRFINDSLVVVPDSMANKYSNSINSVHYFAYLPYGLNDPAVQKELLGEITINNQPYYKVKISFTEEGGGDDFEDVFLYWFHKETFKPDFLAYEFKVNGGGIRFREAYNERYIDSIRFVDYINYKPTDETPFIHVDSLYIKKTLEELSKIELKDIVVQNP